MKLLIDSSIPISYPWPFALLGVYLTDKANTNFSFSEVSEQCINSIIMDDTKIEHRLC